MTELRQILRDAKEAYVDLMEWNEEPFEENVTLYDAWTEAALKWWESAVPPKSTWILASEVHEFPNSEDDARGYVGWDIEIAKDIPPDTEWQEVAPLGITCGAISRGNKAAVVWRSRDDGPMSKEECQDMVKFLMDIVDKGYVITTWNGLSFDFPVLAQESGMHDECAELALNHVDMMYHVVCLKGFGIGLDTVAKTMELGGKTEGMSGALAPILWRAGDFDRVLGYVAQDAKSTVVVAKTCDYAEVLKWTTRKGKISKLPLSGGWLTVREANQLPVPDTSWMEDDSIWKRERFMGWINGEST